jgi:hypothetical protein
MQERAGQQKTTKFLNVCIKEANFALKISNLGLLKTLKGKKILRQFVILVFIGNG